MSAALWRGHNLRKRCDRAGPHPGNDHLDAYTAVVSAEQLATIAKQGLDISDQTDRRRMGSKSIS